MPDVEAQLLCIVDVVLEVLFFDPESQELCFQVQQVLLLCVLPSKLLCVPGDVRLPAVARSVTEEEVISLPVSSGILGHFG